MTVPLAILEAARVAALPAGAVSEAAAITAGVDVALAPVRRGWGRRLLHRLDELPITATSQRVYRRPWRKVLRGQGGEIDHVELPTLRPARHPQPGSGTKAPGLHPTFDGPRGPRCR